MSGSQLRWQQKYFTGPGGLSHSESNLSRRVLTDIFHPLTVSSFSKSLPRSLLPQSQLPRAGGSVLSFPTLTPSPENNPWFWDQIYFSSFPQSTCLPKLLSSF